jgi:hypothetical protein
MDCRLWSDHKGDRLPVSVADSRTHPADSQDGLVRLCLGIRQMPR